MQGGEGEYTIEEDPGREQHELEGDEQWLIRPTPVEGDETGADEGREDLAAVLDAGAAAVRVAQPQRERRVLGIAEPMHRIELNRGIRVPNRRTQSSA